MPLPKRPQPPVLLAHPSALGDLQARTVRDVRRRVASQLGQLQRVRKGHPVPVYRYQRSRRTEECVRDGGGDPEEATRTAEPHQGHPQHVRIEVEEDEQDVREVARMLFGSEAQGIRAGRVGERSDGTRGVYDVTTSSSEAATVTVPQTHATWQSRRIQLLPE